MQRKQRCTVVRNEKMAEKTYRLRVHGDTRGFAAGKFVNVGVPGFTLRRPLAICEYDGDGFTMVYKTVGEGTKTMTGLMPGDKLELLCPLGNGFTLRGNSRVLLVGGGVGVAPLVALARELAQRGNAVYVACGFGAGAEAYMQEELAGMARHTALATLDGSAGCKGTVVDLLAQDAELAGAFDYFYACGPMPMLRAVCQSVKTPGEVSLEERMACGFGACMGCAIPTASGMKRVCKDGPVFAKEEMLW